ncbi:hypothetical protein KR084_007214 [Drosophila pseudotakahashii]|nr:hypothetical protein KR084_007214 [Drosophila pseudotakahashii]
MVLNSVGSQGSGSSTLPLPPLNTSAPKTPFDNTDPHGGDIICVPVSVLLPDPKDPTKTIEVDQIACYPAPSMENGQKRSDGPQDIIITSIVVTFLVAYCP